MISRKTSFRLFAACGCLLACLVHARRAGEPRSWSLPGKSGDAIALIELPAIDPARLLSEDMAGLGSSKGGGALRFAVPRALSATPADEGTWTPLPGGGRLWQLRLRVPGATDLNFSLARFVLPEGATLHFFSTSERYYQGPYTAADVKPHGGFWSPVLPGEEAVVELHLPQGSGPAQIALASVNAGYRDLFGRKGGPLLKQGSCNIDVVCPEGDLYRDEIRSVARYTINGSSLCTGTLMMDAAGTFTPWFLTAAHCGVSNESVADSLVFYWNYESPTCGALAGGTLDDNQAGSAFRARRNDVDMSLVELDAPPDPDFNVHYAGWDRSGTAPGASVHIHHPSGDEKAISFNDDPLTTGNNCIAPGTSTHWIIDNYEQGTTEPGSSGSGVWTPAPSARLIGFLSGGGASCNNPELGDCYGKFSAAWNGASASQRLVDWLGNGLPSPPVTVDGSDPAGFSLSLDPQQVELCRPDSAAVDVDIGASGGFSEPVTLSTSGTPTGLTTSFSVNPVFPPGTSLLTLDTGASTTVGDFDVLVNGDSATQSRSRLLDLSVDANPPASAPSLLSPAPAAAGVDRFPIFSWGAVTGAASYRLEVAADGDFGNPAIDVLVDTTSYPTTEALPASTAWQWRVTALNACGASAASAASGFSTGTALCRTEDAAIPDGNPIGVSRTVAIPDPGMLTNLDLAVQVTHTWVGDIGIVLRHEDTGTEVAAIDRPGVPASEFGCNGDDIDAVLDDGAASPVEDQCAAAVPSIDGTYVPNRPLAGFDGETLAGSWTIRANDVVTPDAGTLVRWCLLPTVAVPTLIFADGFERVP